LEEAGVQLIRSLCPVQILPSQGSVHKQLAPWLSLVPAVPVGLSPTRGEGQSWGFVGTQLLGRVSWKEIRFTQGKRCV